MTSTIMCILTADTSYVVGRSSVIYLYYTYGGTNNLSIHARGWVNYTPQEVFFPLLLKMAQ